MCTKLINREVVFWKCNARHVSPLYNENTKFNIVMQEGKEFSVCSLHYEKYELKIETYKKFSFDAESHRVVRTLLFIRFYLCFSTNIQKKQNQDFYRERFQHQKKQFRH